MNTKSTTPGGTERLFYWVLLSVALAGLATAYLPDVIGQPPSVWWREFVRVFSYFTILSNLAVALLASGQLFLQRSAWAAVLGSMAGKTSIAVYLSMTGIVYHLLLAGTWSPEGIDKVSDILTHTVTPCLYVAFWFTCGCGQAMPFRHTLSLLGLPILFLLYWLLRGPIVGSYPYFFIDVDRFGYARVLLNSSGLCLAAWLLGIGYWAISAWSKVARANVPVRSGSNMSQ